MLIYRLSIIFSIISPTPTPLTSPFNPLGPTRPTPWPSGTLKADPLTPWDPESESRINSQTYLGQFVLDICKKINSFGEKVFSGKIYTAGNFYTTAGCDKFQVWLWGPFLASETQTLQTRHNGPEDWAECKGHLEGRHRMLYFNIQRTKKYSKAMCYYKISAAGSHQSSLLSGTEWVS